MRIERTGRLPGFRGLTAKARILYNMRHEAGNKGQLRFPNPASVGVYLRRQDEVACKDGDRRAEPHVLSGKKWQKGSAGNMELGKLTERPSNCPVNSRCSCAKGEEPRAVQVALKQLEKQSAKNREHVVRMSPIAESKGLAD